MIDVSGAATIFGVFDLLLLSGGACFGMHYSQEKIMEL